MILTLIDPKYLKPYDSVGKASRWQTDAVAKDIASLLSGHGIHGEIESDDDGSLISWTDARMQVWIGVECLDPRAAMFRLDIGAGQRMMLVFALSFPDTVFADAQWLKQVRAVASASADDSGGSAKRAITHTVADGGQLGIGTMKRPSGGPGFMPIWLHLTLAIGGQICGVFFLFALVVTALGAKRMNWSPLLVLAFGASALGFLTPWLVFKHFIPAKCPKCGGKAMCRGGQPITYRCRSCGRVHRTRVNGSESW